MLPSAAWLWAAMGVGNIVLGLQNTGFGTAAFEADWAAANLLVSMAFFILPGLVVAGVGEGLRVGGPVDVALFEHAPEYVEAPPFCLLGIAHG